MVAADSLRRAWSFLFPTHVEEGFGQSLADDCCFLWRFRGCRRAAAVWRLPSDDERRAIDAHAILGRFGDHTDVLADVGGRRWIARERDWFGRPDPPRWAFFALNTDGQIWAAADFNFWPGTWSRPKDESARNDEREG